MSVSCPDRYEERQEAKAWEGRRKEEREREKGKDGGEGGEGKVERREES